MDKIVKMKFGSHLYGLNTPDSDVDYKGIFQPSLQECVLNQIPKSFNKSTGNDRSRNTKEDVDYEIYSLQYFIELGLKGETVVLDMIHCPEDKNILIETSSKWDFIRKNRHKFYTKNLKSFFGYALKQAAKYGIRGSRISTCKEVIGFLKSSTKEKMWETWDKLPEIEHTYKDGEFYEVCGKKFQKTVKIEYVIPILEKYLKDYGERALLAEKNKGIDWKALSHAVRAGLQIESIYKNKDIVFPFSGTKKDFLLNIKQGRLDYKTEVAPELENIMERVTELSKTVNLPEKPDRKFWKKFIIDCY